MGLRPGRDKCTQVNAPAQVFEGVMRWPDRAGEASVMRPEFVRMQMVGFVLKIGLSLGPSGMVSENMTAIRGVLRWSILKLSHALFPSSVSQQTLHKPRPN